MADSKWSKQKEELLKSKTKMWQYTAGRPPLYQPPEPLMAIRSSSGFSHLWLGVFHFFFTDTQNTTYTTERGGEKREQTRTWISSKHEKFVTFS